MWVVTCAGAEGSVGAVEALPRLEDRGFRAASPTSQHCRCCTAGIQRFVHSLPKSFIRIRHPSISQLIILAKKISMIVMLLSRK
jgi:hypothetical protein